MVSQGRYKYIRTLVKGETEELYDLTSDPQELNNLAVNKKYESIISQYRKLAIDELKRTDAGFAENMPAVKKHY